MLEDRSRQIAFHDIVRDHGTDSDAWAGGVPVFWQEVRERFVHWELVRDWSRNGCGIGVIEHDPAVTV